MVSFYLSLCNDLGVVTLTWFVDIDRGTHMIMINFVRKVHINICIIVNDGKYYKFQENVAYSSMILPTFHIQKFS